MNAGYREMRRGTRGRHTASSAERPIPGTSGPMAAHDSEQGWGRR